MKHLKPLFLLIPIVLALLLSDARNASAQPSPGTIQKSHRKPATKQESAQRAKNDQHQPRASSRPLSAIAPNRTAQDRAAAESAMRAAEQEAHLKRQEQLAAATLAVTQKTLDTTQQSLELDRKLVWFTGVLAVINLLTMMVFYRTVSANIIAANATRDAVQVSKSAVRPYLWVSNVKGETHPPSLTQVGPESRNVLGFADCNIQNLGKGPAFITEVAAKLKFSSAPLPLPPAFNDCLKVIVLQPVVPAAESTNFLVPLSQTFASQDTEKMNDQRASERFSCYGTIKYRDAFGTPYCTNFGFSRQWGKFSDSEEPHWTFVPSPAYNRDA
jgi:hypothetical protein